MIPQPESVAAHLVGLVRRCDREGVRFRGLSLDAERMVDGSAALHLIDARGVTVAGYLLVVLGRGHGTR